MAEKKSRAQLALEAIEKREKEDKKRAIKLRAIRRKELNQRKKGEALEIGKLLQGMGFTGVPTSDIESWVKLAKSATPLPWPDDSEDDNFSAPAASETSQPTIEFHD